MAQSLFTQTIRQKLLANWASSYAGEDIDPVPIVKLFTSDANADDRVGLPFKINIDYLFDYFKVDAG